MNSVNNRTIAGLAGGVSFGVLLGCMAGCTATSPQLDTNPVADADPIQMARDLFERITITDPYEEWDQFPEAQGLVPSAAPHGEQADIRINDVVASALDNFTGSLPDDSIILKQNFNGQGEKADALTVMWKVSRYDPDNDDWFWANLSVQGEVNAAGKLDGCINCHAGVRGNDFVFTHQF